MRGDGVCGRSGATGAAGFAATGAGGATGEAVREIGAAAWDDGGATTGGLTGRAGTGTVDGAAEEAGG